MTLRDRDRLRERLGAFGISESAKDWVVKTLDPAATMSTKGVPDSSACSVMRPEYTLQFTINTPSIPTSTWDCYIIFIPGNVNAALYAYGPGGTDFSASTTPANCGFGWMPLENFVDLPGATKWTLANSDGAAPYTTNMYGLFGIRAPASNPLTFRHVYKSATIDLIAPAVANQGDVFVGQYPPDFRRTGRAIAVEKVNATGDNLVYLVDECALPMNEEDLSLSSRSPYVGLAKDGVYIPLKHPGPTMSFADVAYSGGAGTCHAVNGNTGSMAIGTMVLANGFGVQFPRSFVVVNNDTGGSTGSETPWINNVWANESMGYDTGYDNTNVGVAIFRGLSAGGGGGGFGASLLLKLKVGLEVCPRPTTAARVYALPPHVYEPRAIEAYYALAAEMAAAYPSSYNALGMLMPLLSGVAARIVPALTAGASAFMREFGGPPPREARPKIVEREVVKTVRLPQRSASIRSTKSTRSRPGSVKSVLKTRRKRR